MSHWTGFGETILMVCVSFRYSYSPHTVLLPSYLFWLYMHDVVAVISLLLIDIIGSYTSAACVNLFALCSRPMNKHKFR